MKKWLASYVCEGFVEIDYHWGESCNISSFICYLVLFMLTNYAGLHESCDTGGGWGWGGLSNAL